jgi:hypothetical protein
MIDLKFSLGEYFLVDSTLFAMKFNKFPLQFLAQYRPPCLCTAPYGGRVAESIGCYLSSIRAFDSKGLYRYPVLLHVADRTRRMVVTVLVF